MIGLISVAVVTVLASHHMAQHLLCNIHHHRALHCYITVAVLAPTFTMQLTDHLQSTITVVAVSAYAWRARGCQSVFA